MAEVKSLFQVFVAVNLFQLEPRKIVAIPGNWIKGLTLAKVINNGLLHKRRKQTIFYFEDISRQPNFNLESRVTFDKNTPSCYNAKIIKSFGKLSEESDNN